MLLSYLRRHIKIIVLLALFVLIFAVVFSLYDLPAEAVFYAAALCLLVGLVLFFIGYVRYLWRHRTLSELARRITVSLDGLPAPRGRLEGDYQQLVKTLYRETARVRSAADSAEGELLDYFTLWVHQIKTPIAAMRLMLQAEQSAGNMALAAELLKIEQYVDMALQYLRLGSDTTDLVIRACSLDDIIRQSVRKYAGLFILKKIRLDFQETNLQVTTDEKWLCFILDQLLVNALKYTPAGTVTIRAEGLDLLVEDTGVGIRAEDLPRIFEKGFTGLNGREDKNRPAWACI
jgi:signal transduction histidine kinase